MLNDYCAAVLARELAKADYDGMSADEAYAWLTQPSDASAQAPTHAKLTPLLAAATIGPAKAEALAAKIQAALPTIAGPLMAQGVDLSDALTAAFLGSMVDGEGVLQTDVEALLSLGTRGVSASLPARFSRRFSPDSWPHVAEDGSEGDENDPAIHGFPNLITREEFDLGWAAAGRG